MVYTTHALYPQSEEQVQEPMTSFNKYMNTSGGDAVSPPIFWNVYMPWASSFMETEG